MESGYWASAVGFYGGVNYGSGYFGNGYDGGRWANNTFRYNSYVSHVDTRNIRNVYVDRTAYVNTSATRVSYNGGKYGLQARPTTLQLSVAKQRHLGMTPVQQQHVVAAEQDRRLLARVNGNRPPVTAVARPLSATNRPAALVPVKAAERVDPLANVVPANVRPVRAAARPAPQALPPQRVTALERAPVIHEAEPVAHAPVAHAPVVRKAEALSAPPAVYAAPRKRAPVRAPLAVPAPGAASHARTPHVRSGVNERPQQHP